ncbi:MAG: TlyA family RNA methyltransferase, partial [Synergistaceae bacterium]|nr:TlyA family RNA methyltransferase [Synergistaceae bacterium]
MAKNLRRLDKLLVEKGLAPSREAARELISAGAVRVAGIQRSKPSSMFQQDIAINVEGADEPRWVSRG